MHVNGRGGSKNRETGVRTAHVHGSTHARARGTPSVYTPILLRIVISLDSVTAIGFKGHNNNRGGGRRPGFEAIRDSCSASRACCASQVAPPPAPGPSVSLEINGPSAIATSGDS